MKNIKTVIAIAVLVIIIIGLTLIKPGTDSQTIRIGALVPLTGPSASLGEWMKKGATQAVDEINQNGGIDGKIVELVIEDDACTGSKSVSAYQKLYSADKIKYFIGPLCAAARVPVLKAAESDDAILITTGLAITYGQENIKAKTFNVLPSVSAIADAVLDYSIANLGSKKFSVLAVDDEVGKETRLAVENNLKQKGLTLSLFETYPKGSQDLRSQITKLKNDPSDTIFVASFPAEYAVFVKQASELGLNKKILGLSTVQGKDIATADTGTKIKMYYAHPMDSSLVNGSSVYFGSGYDAIKLLSLGIKDCGQNTTCAHKVISQITGYEGANGPVSFGQNGNVNSAKSIEVRLLEDGKFRKVD